MTVLSLLRNTAVACGFAETLTEAGGVAGRAVQSVVLALLPGMLSVKLVLLQHQMVQVCLARLQVHTMGVDLMGPLVEATLLHLHSDTRSWLYKDCEKVHAARSTMVSLKQPMLILLPNGVHQTFCICNMFPQQL